ncbi:hypothetical protein, partial [Halorubrum persicum]|uniref:hypothetical protein n=1 Tax=Halorubrum persicum TaxID=1383844 RepID=UPI001181914B
LRPSPEADATASGEGRNGTGSGSTADGDGETAEAERAGEAVGTAKNAGATETAEIDRVDPETRAVIEELSDVDLAETAPVELLSRVQAWQERLDENR